MRYRGRNTRGRNKRGNRQDPRALAEAELDAQVVEMLRSIRQPEPVRGMFMDMLSDWRAHEGEHSRCDADDAQRQMTVLRQRHDQLLNMWRAQEINAETFGAGRAWSYAIASRR